MDNTTQCIENLRAKLERHRKADLKETPTRRIFVDALLQALGWDVTDPDEVELECSTVDGKSVDYALKADGKPVLFVEAKPLNDPLTDVKSITQVVGYAANAGVKWCLLTNGVAYKVYDSYEKAEAPEKLLFEISIDREANKDMPVQQIAERLSLLSRDSMAKHVLDEIGRETFTTGKIRKALDRIFASPPSAFIRLVRSTIGDDTVKPAEIKQALGRLWARTPDLRTPLSGSPVGLTRTREMASVKERAITYDVSRGTVSGIDTVVVPAREDGFQDVFLGENRWYAIRMRQSLIPRIKYIAAYQVAPVSAITHWAPVKNVETWPDTGRFVVNFAGPAKEIGPLSLVAGGKVKAPQSIRYTSFDRLRKAKTLDEVF